MDIHNWITDAIWNWTMAIQILALWVAITAHWKLMDLHVIFTHNIILDISNGIMAMHNVIMGLHYGIMDIHNLWEYIDIHNSIIIGFLISLIELWLSIIRKFICFWLSIKLLKYSFFLQKLK